MKNALNSSITMVIIFITIVTIMSRPIAAQTKTPTPTPGQSPSGAAPSPTPQITAEEKEQDTIEKIKDLVASKVAELKLVDKRGILGVVKRISNSQIVIEDHKEDQRSIDIDELTKFVSSKSSFGISDIKEGDRISAIGLYNKDTKRLLARFINVSENVPINIEGVVTGKNSREFTLTVIDSGGKTNNIDIESSTKTNVWDDKTLTKSGFSKVLVGQRVIVIGFPDLNSKETVNASRIIHFANLPISEVLLKYAPVEESGTPTPTNTSTR